MDLPDIEWKGYIESLQQVAKQHTSLYKTRRHNTGNKPLIFELDEKPVSLEKFNAQTTLRCELHFSLSLSLSLSVCQYQAKGPQQASLLPPTLDTRRTGNRILFIVTKGLKLIFKSEGGTMGLKSDTVVFNFV